MMGWRKGILFHNVLAMSAYLITGLALLYGLPWVLAWPFLLTLPLALFQVVQINSIQAGAAPKWNLVKVSSYALTGLALYLVTFSLWVG
jgi:1,4-dihydroxy-2-naphthoate octaprenyltransferase